MILVTQKDGTSVALNVDRIERIERNAISRGQGSNIFFVGGGHLVVEESQEALIELVVDAKARVHARGTGMVEERAGGDDRNRHRPPVVSPLRMVPNPEIVP
jgi:uncharacterized protein YlzI (FlbEa/FlbD family)